MQGHRVCESWEKGQETVEAGGICKNGAGMLRAGKLRSDFHATLKYTSHQLWDCAQTKGTCLYCKVIKLLPKTTFQWPSQMASKKGEGRERGRGDINSSGF